jgi:hypothetical protein
MFLLAQSPRFNTGTPGVLNSGNELTITLPLLNIGVGDAANMKVTSMTLGSAQRLSPAGLPLFIGGLAVNNTTAVSGRFASGELAVGSKALLTVQGTYELGGATYGFAVNRYISIPAPAPPPFVTLKARVQVATEPGLWTYTIFNDEPLNSQQFIAAFSLEIAAPVIPSGVPPGWDVETDNATYVLWYAIDPALPYPHHIAPGTNLTGFQIQSKSNDSESTSYVVTGWNHQSDQADLASADVVLSPLRTA